MAKSDFFRRPIVYVLASILSIALFGLLAPASPGQVQFDETAAGAAFGRLDDSPSNCTHIESLGRTESISQEVDDNNVPPVAVHDDASVGFEAMNAGAARILWEDDFSGNWESRWPTVYVNKKEQYSTFEYGGSTWLRVTYPEGHERVGFHMKTKFPPQARMYLEYQLRFAEDFDWVRGGKLPGLYGGAVKAGVAPNGKDGFLVRFMWRSDGKGSAYVYHPDQPKKYGEHFRLENFWFQKGVVQTLGLEVVLNTPGKHDGIVRAWLDGTLVVDETDMRFRDIASLQIDGIKFDTIFGGNDSSWAPTKDEHIDFGGFKIYSEARVQDHGASPPNP